MRNVHKTQGLEFYVLDTITSPVRALKLGNLTNLGGLGGQTSKIDKTTFDDLTHRQSLSGLVDNSDLSSQFIYDMSSEAHAFLRDNVGSSFQFAIGYSNDFGQEPNPNASEDGFDLPNTRHWTTFEGSIASDMRNFELDSIVKFDAAIRPSGEITDTLATA